MADPDLTTSSISTIDRLAHTVTAAGKSIEIWSSPDGSRVTVLPYGARLLGLFAPGSNKNFFWTHPALLAAESARQFYGSSEWHNSGGDRTWLAPEVDFFFPHYPALDTYVQPRELDAGNYRLTRNDGSITLAHHFTLQLSRSKCDVELKLTKRISPAQHPLRLRSPSEFSKLQYAGYELRTNLEIVTRTHSGPIQVGIWNLVQLPHGGEFLIPTHSRATPKTFFGHVDGRDLDVSERLIRYRTRSAGEDKLGIDAVSATGRIGYLYSEEEEYSLVIRNIAVNPSGNYVDVPSSATNDFGYAIQACSINSRLGSFAELEYHVPATGGQAADCSRQDDSQLWAFRGPQHAILEVARILLCSDV